ncbi:MAG: ferric iron uptake transcriptional regulator [Gammaproteobacteria bacterium TMED119]|nr:MAG: ferric iron uptake transcriptional regulator [Gammaproteobacteria bacterium TMED119]RCL44494.1 MAG: ferric iron uptake transcriptional regulator [Candidatus Thioglobus sp.]|tara:strand:+ start:1316 stop:1732 length:417 start_codon:yes stop_codon:yes gene_type:complete
MENQDLRRAGLKVTLPRMKILEILESSSKPHLSAEDIYRMLMDSDEDIGLATVYRVLTQFETAGLVIRHHFEGGQGVFELDRGKHHDHLICIKCGKIIEFVNADIEEQQHQIAEQEGFTITDHSLIIYGECNKKDCEA